MGEFIYLFPNKHFYVRGSKFLINVWHIYNANLESLNPHLSSLSFHGSLVGRECFVYIYTQLGQTTFFLILLQKHSLLRKKRKKKDISSCKGIGDDEKIETLVSANWFTRFISGDDFGNTAFYLSFSVCSIVLRRVLLMFCW